jgi:hypothetical protein
MSIGKMATMAGYSTNSSIYMTFLEIKAFFKKKFWSEETQTVSIVWFLFKVRVSLVVQTS